MEAGERMRGTELGQEVEERGREKEAFLATDTL